MYVAITRLLKYLNIYVDFIDSKYKSLLLGILIDYEFIISRYYLIKLKLYYFFMKYM